MIRDKFPATFKTGLLVTITYCCKLINIVTRLPSIPEDAGTLNTPLVTLVIKMQSSPNHHTVGLKPTSGNSLSRSLVNTTDWQKLWIFLYFHFYGTIVMWKENILLILCRDLLFNHNTLLHGHRLWLTYDLFWPVRCKSSIDNLVKPCNISNI